MGIVEAVGYRELGPLENEALAFLRFVERESKLHRVEITAAA